MVQQRNMPALTMVIVGASLLAYCSPWVSGWLVYDRDAILAGQWWRVMTSSIVHFSPSHLFWNVMVFGAAGWIIETAPYRGFWLVIGLSACTPGVLLLLVLPQFEFFGGLSGLATGAVAYLCLCKAWRVERGRAGWLVLLGLIGVKIFLETVMDAPLFAGSDHAAFRVVPGVHVAGFLSALVVHEMDWATGRAGPDSPSAQ